MQFWDDNLIKKKEEDGVSKAAMNFGTFCP